MKNCCTLLVFLFLLAPSSSRSQIPNADFESWVFMGWYDDPESWSTNNTQIMALMVIKDPDFYTGQYAVKLLTSNNLIPTLKTGFPLTDHPSSLNAYVKTSLAPADSVYLLAALYNNNVLVDIGIKYISTSIGSYSLVSVPISSNATVIDSVAIEIYGGLNYGTEFKLDHLQLEYEATSVPVINDEPLSVVLQNPFHEIITFNHAKAERNFAIDVFDLQGSILFHYENSNAPAGTVVADASGWNAGIYFCRVQNGQSASVEKIVKQ